MHGELTMEELHDKIDVLETMLKDMEYDFYVCAKTNKSPCFFCCNDDVCDGTNCNFLWQPHI